MINHPLPRLDLDSETKTRLLPHCRLTRGEVWHDPKSGHRVGCLDASNLANASQLCAGSLAKLAVHDPPYNHVAFECLEISAFIHWCKAWIDSTNSVLHDDSSLYIWLGADQRQGFQPLPDFMVMMRSTRFHPRSFITMRNQRGYGTQRNWMAIRQELLYYTKGTPTFNVSAEYTDIPKVLRGYYKEVNGVRQENLERGRADTIRAGNVWVDIQQVFYRMQENVSGCYAQKPLKSCERIIRASSNPGDIVLDFFAHSGSTLLASEILGRTCFTMDIDPVFCEIAIRRLERFRTRGETGWQNSNPFAAEIARDERLRTLLPISATLPDSRMDDAQSATTQPLLLP